MHTVWGFMICPGKYLVGTQIKDESYVIDNCDKERLKNTLWLPNFDGLGVLRHPLTLPVRINRGDICLVLQ